METQQEQPQPQPQQSFYSCVGFVVSDDDDDDNNNNNDNSNKNEDLGNESKDYLTITQTVQKTKPPNIPLPVILGDILPFLDHDSWLNVSAINKETRKLCMTMTSFLPPWPTTVLIALENRAVSMCFSPNGKFLAHAERNGRIHIINRLGRKKRICVCNSLDQISFCPADSSLLAIGAGSGPLSHTTLFDLSRNVTATLPFPEGYTRSDLSTTGAIAWSPCGTYLAQVFNDETIHLYDIINQQYSHTLTGADRPAEYIPFNETYLVQFSPNQQFIAALLQGQLFIWNLERPYQPITIGGHIYFDNNSLPFSFSPDGNFIACVKMSNQVYIYSLENQRDTSRIKSKCVYVINDGLDDSLHWVSYDPNDSKKIIVVSRRGIVKSFQIVFDRNGTIAGHLCIGLDFAILDDLHKFNFSPDGKKLALVGNERNVFWRHSLVMLDYPLAVPVVAQPLPSPTRTQEQQSRRQGRRRRQQQQQQRLSIRRLRNWKRNLMSLIRRRNNNV